MSAGVSRQHRLVYIYTICISIYLYIYIHTHVNGNKTQQEHQMEMARTLKFIWNRHAKTTAVTTISELQRQAATLDYRYIKRCLPSYVCLFITPVYNPTYTHKPIQLKMYLLSGLVCLGISHLSWVGGTNLCSIITAEVEHIVDYQTIYSLSSIVSCL